MIRSSITNAAMTALRKQCGHGRYSWASLCAPWRSCGGTGQRAYVIKAKARKAAKP